MFDSLSQIWFMKLNLLSQIQINFIKIIKYIHCFVNNQQLILHIT